MNNKSLALFGFFIALVAVVAGAKPSADNTDNNDGENSSGTNTGTGTNTGGTAPVPIDVDKVLNKSSVYSKEVEELQKHIKWLLQNRANQLIMVHNKWTQNPSLFIIDGLFGNTTMYMVAKIFPEYANGLVSIDSQGNIITPVTATSSITLRKMCNYAAYKAGSPAFQCYIP